MTADFFGLGVTITEGCSVGPLFLVVRTVCRLIYSREIKADLLDNIEFIVEWVARIGLVVGFIGAVQFALGFKDDSADGKTRGLMCLASGFIVFAVSKAYSMFTM